MVDYSIFVDTDFIHATLAIHCAWFLVDFVTLVFVNWLNF